MPRFVAFLRGINLGRRRPPMAELQRLFEELGFADVATFIASGNVIFESPGRDGRKLEVRIETQLAAHLGYEVDTFVRRTDEVAAVLQARVRAGPATEGGSLHVVFLKTPLSASQRKLLAACETAVDRLKPDGREIYWLCRIRTPDSKVWSSPAMKAVGLSTYTMRNLTSLQKLAAKIDLPATGRGET
ncbi:MAG: DUF1697 domain-containing protein [Opitutales bacterium]